jgi:hypothetical protein
MPAIATPHLNALLFQLLERRCGGSVLINLRVGRVLAGDKELWEDRRMVLARRYMVGNEEASVDGNKERAEMEVDNNAL